MLLFVRLVAIYLDFLVFSSVLELLVYAVGAPPEFTPLLRAAAALMAALFAAYFGLSLGNWLVHKIFQRAAAGLGNARLRISLITGAVCFLEASKHLVRWTQMDRPLPFMGVIPEGGEQIALGLALGVLYLAMAAPLLRLHHLGRWLTAAVSVMFLVSTAVSWRQFPEAVERYVIARRSLQGLPVREGEIEAMQIYVPSGMIVWSVLLFLAALFCYSTPIGKPHASAK